MTGHSPNFDDWRMRDSMTVYEVACLMNGFDPRAMADATVRDLEDPTYPFGIPFDTAWDEGLLIAALAAGTLLSAPPNVAAANKNTRIQAESLVPWLKAKGYEDLAMELSTRPGPGALRSGSTNAPPSTPKNPEMTEPERRLKALRELGGEARWKHYRGETQWCFTKISELVTAEKHAGRKRHDEKTIRKDLREAAETERLAKASGKSNPWGDRSTGA